MNSEATTLSTAELREMHPADAADALQRMPAEQAYARLLELPKSFTAQVLVEMDDEFSTEVLVHVPEQELSQFLRELPANHVADLVGQLEIDRRRQVLSRMPEEKASAVRGLLRYPEDTAGGIMSDRFIALRADRTVQQTQDTLRKRPESHRQEDVSYLYVTDELGRLLGVVSLRDLLFSRPDRLVEDIIKRDVVYVRVDDDQEEIARKFEHYHFLGLPVLDYNDRLVGIVRASDALHIAQAEATEDMQLMVGLSGEERSLTPWGKSVVKRLPWLYINLLTAFLAAAVVGFYEDTITQWTALAIFLPVVAGMGGNAGMQTLTVIIRDMALGEINPGDGRKALLKEVVVGLINGLAIGVVVGVAGWFWKGSYMLGILVGIAMILNLVAAALSGVLIPFGLKWMKIDPALASSIFVTTVTDVAGFFFFLGLASVALAWWGVL